MDPVAEPEVRPVAAADIEYVGSRNRPGSRLAEPRLTSTCSCAGISTPSRVTGSVVTRNVAMRDRGGEPDELVDRGGKLPGIGQQRLELAGVIQQGHHPVTDEAGRGVVAGDYELEQAR